MSEGIGINFWTIIFQVSNFFILMFVLNKFLYKPLIGMIENRKKAAGQLEIDKKFLQDQKEFLSAEKAVILRQAKEEINKMRAEAQIEIKKNQEQMKILAEKDAERIKNDAKSMIQKQIDEKLTEIDRNIQSKALELFENIVQSELTEKQKKHFTSLVLNNDGK
jgi:F-type H+-transporting ATPase subunit b